MSHDCPRCGTSISAAEQAERHALCPNCGLRIGPPEVSRPMEIIREYFLEIWKILTQPSDYFSRMPGGAQGGKVARALGFALVTHWLGAVIAFFWQAMGSSLLQRQVSAVFQFLDDDIQTLHGLGAAQSELREKFFQWFWGMGSVIADPFLTLAGILFTAFFVFIGARILVPSEPESLREVSLESAIKIVAYGTTASIISVIPWVGSVVAPIGVAVLTIIGARTVYRISTGRAVVVALFPKILFVGVILLGFLLFAAAMIRLVASFF